MIAGTFDGENNILARPRLQVGQCQSQRFPYQTIDFQLPLAGVDSRPVEMRNTEEFVVGRHPRVQILPDELSLNDRRNGIGRRLIEPRNHGLSRAAGKSLGEARLKDRQGGEGRTATHDEISARQMEHSATSMGLADHRLKNFNPKQAQRPDRLQFGSELKSSPPLDNG
jgi:hypothetical protein